MNFARKNSFVFPSAYRKFDLNGRFTSENNFINIIKCLATAENNSFVVDCFIAGTTTNPVNKVATGSFYDLYVVIGGYYFELKEISIPKNLTLYIRTDGTYLKNFSTGTTELDDDSNFLGISDTNTDNNATASLKITDANGNILNRGYIKELTDNNGNWININLFFKNLINGGAGNTNQPIYLSNSEGFTPLKATVGVRPAALPNNYQNVYLDKGTITEGQRITISTTSPGATDATTIALRNGAKVGDL